MKVIEATNIYKACINASSDVKALQRTWPELVLQPTAFVDPGKIAKHIGVTPRENVSMIKLTKLLLGKTVDKTFQIASYATNALAKNTAQLAYAALDAVLHYKLYVKMIELRTFVEGELENGDEVMVFDSTRHRKVLCGHVVGTASINGVDVVDVKVTKVHIPGFVVRYNDRKTVEQLSGGKDSDFVVRVPNTSACKHIDEHDGFAEIDAKVGTDNPNTDADGTSLDWDRLLCRLDAVHSMFRISTTLKKKHGQYKKFMARLRDAMFNISQEDVAAVKKQLEDRGFSLEEIEDRYLGNYRYFVARCRRTIPPPTELRANMEAVFAHFEDNGMDARSKVGHLFTPRFRKAWKRLLTKHVDRGCLSDPLDVNLYYEVTTPSGRVILRCERGTSPLEGFHQHLRRVFHCYVISVYFASLLLAEFVTRWNARARYGARF
jgi:hypothetical protein